jgi:hypothetical protein
MIEDGVLSLSGAPGVGRTRLATLLIAVMEEDDLGQRETIKGKEYDGTPRCTDSETKAPRNPVLLR